MQSAKDVAASAKAGMEKTKAAVQEKAEKMTTRDPLQKEMATEKKEARMHEAERMKHETRGHPTPLGGTTGYTAEETTTGGGLGSQLPTGTGTGTTGVTGRTKHQDPNVPGTGGYGTGGTY